MIWFWCHFIIFMCLSHNEINHHTIHQTTDSNTTQPYRPLPIEGKATDFRFFASARVRQFLTVLSRFCWELSDFHVGPLQCITYLAGKWCPGQMAAVKEQHNKALMLNGPCYPIRLCCVVRWQSVCTCTGYWTMGSCWTREVNSRAWWGHLKSRESWKWDWDLQLCDSDDEEKKVGGSMN